MRKSLADIKFDNLGFVKESEYKYVRTKIIGEITERTVIEFNEEHQAEIYTIAEKQSYGCYFKEIVPTTLFKELLDAIRCKQEGIWD